LYRDVGETALFLSLIPLPLSFRKVPGRSVAYWVGRKNAMGICDHMRGVQELDTRRDLA
jgi:hypothetical protein